MDQIIESGGVKLKIDGDGDVFVTLPDEVSASILVGRNERGDFVRAVAKLGLALPVHETFMMTLEGPRFEDAALLAPPSADDVKIASDYAAELAHPERSLIERSVGMTIGRLVRHTARGQRFVAFGKARAENITPGSERSEVEKKIIDRAVARMHGAVERLIPGDGGEVPDPSKLDDADACALALGILCADFMFVVTKAPSHTRCAWCVDAAGDDHEKLAEVPAYTMAQARTHTMHCEHNPLVQRIAELEAELGAEQRDRAALVERLNAEAASHKLTDAEAGNAQVFAARLREAASNLLDAIVGVGAATWQRAWDDLTLLCGRACAPWDSAVSPDDQLAAAFRAGISTGHAEHGRTEEEYVAFAQSWLAYQKGLDAGKRHDEAQIAVARETTVGTATRVADWRDVPPRSLSNVAGLRAACVVCGKSVDVEIWCADHADASLSGDKLEALRAKIGRLIDVAPDVPSQYPALIDSIIQAARSA